MVQGDRAVKGGAFRKYRDGRKVGAWEEACVYPGVQGTFITLK